MIRVFLDASILFSAACQDSTGIGKLWELPDVQLVTSRCVLAEAGYDINNKRPPSSGRLNDLSVLVEVSSSHSALGRDYALPEKDRPILEAAAASECSVLLTGDIAKSTHANLTT